jgi:enediyne biosynthesis protein E4
MGTDIHNSIQSSIQNASPGTALCLVLLLGIASCGGGGGGSALELPPRPTPDANSDNSSNNIPVVEPLAHCEVSSEDNGEGGFFRNVTTELGLCYDATVADSDPTEAEKTGGGLGLGDIDNDGHPELYVAHGRDTQGKLFSFDGERFVEREETGIELRSMDLAGYFIDIDIDGFKDFISVQYEGVQVLINDGTGHFVEWTGVTRIDHRSATWSMAAADYDLDGDVDLFFSHWGTGRIDGETEYLWNNDGTGIYTDVSPQVPIKTTEGLGNLVSEHSFTPTFADFNSDGYPDLLIAGDWLASQVLRNDGGDNFLDLTTMVISDENGMGSAVADYDRDGDLDWFVSSIWAPGAPSNDSGNRLYRNMDGQGTFEDVTDEAGVREGDWGWGSCFADFDNDGHVDLFHTNGYQEPRPRFHDDPSRLFMSNGDGTFTERAAELGITHTAQGRGIICTDYNHDGKVDIFIANSGTSPTVFMNDHSNDNHYIAIDLVGIGANPEAIGARVSVTTASGRQIDEVRLGTAYLSQAPATLHFGLGEDDFISAIDVTWPGPGTPTSRIEMIDVDQRITLTHP